MSSELLILLQLGSMAHRTKLDCLVNRLECSVVVKNKVTKRFKVPVNIHLDDISSTAEPFVTKLGMVMHHPEPVCFKKIGLLSKRSWSQ